MNQDKPHRVIYHHCGKYVTRIFGTKTQAEEFAAAVKDPLIQLATEKPNIPKHKSGLQNNANRIQRVSCECGRGYRLISYEFCAVCSGNARAYK